MRRRDNQQREAVYDGGPLEFSPNLTSVKPPVSGLTNSDIKKIKDAILDVKLDPNHLDLGTKRDSSVDLVCAEEQYENASNPDEIDSLFADHNNDEDEEKHEDKEEEDDSQLDKSFLEDRRKEIPQSISFLDDPEDLSIEDQARAQGWVPKEEYHGRNPWKPADQFIQDGLYIKRYKDQAEKIRELELISKNLLTKLSTADQRAYQKALNDVESLKQKAEFHNDGKAMKVAFETEKQLHEQYKGVSTQTQQIIDNEPDPLLKEYIIANPWITNKNDPKCVAMAKYAEDLSNHYAAKHPGITEEDKKAQLKFVHQQQRKDFPDFEPFKKERESKQRNRHSSVGGVTGTTATYRASSQSDRNELSGLSLADRQTAEFLKKNPIPGYDYKQYIKDIKKG